MREINLEKFERALTDYLNEATRKKEERLASEYLKKKSVIRTIEKQIRKYRKKITG